MEQEIKPNPESLRKRGRNVTFTLRFYRHGDKKEEMLSESGIEQAQKIGSSLEPLRVVKPYGSKF